MATFQPTATPMRQVPGAFFNTPAPQRPDAIRRRLFSDQVGPGPNATSSSDFLGVARTASSSGAVEPASQNQLQPEVSVPPVVKAARKVNETLQVEESYPDLDSYCRPGVSSDYDLHSSDSAWAPFQKAQMYPIPDQIFEKLNGGEVLTKMGLFTEINHAWAAIDSSLFLWDYTHPNPELIGFEESSHTITAVALVPPKPGVFVNTITHLLVVATTSEIVLLGVSAAPSPSGAKTIALYQTKMSVHRGSSDVSLIVGTATGRIFFGGESDIDIHELYYQQEEKWFSSRCGKINHTHPGWSSVVPSIAGPIDFWSQRPNEHLVDIVVDDTRNLIYSLSSNSTIRTYHLEASGKLRVAITKNRTQCLYELSHIVSNRTWLLNEQMQFVSISPIPAREASKLHLMALTSTGCRLFFSATSSAAYTMTPSSNLAPQSMQVQFVKLPPAETPSPEVRQVGQQNGGAELQGLDSKYLNTSISGQRFPPGYFFDFVRRSTHPGADLLFVSTPDTGRIKITTPASALKYYEQATWIDLGENNRALAVGCITKPFAAAPQPLGFGNELAVQFDEAPGDFAILTNTGVHIARRRRLVDIFAAAIRGASGEGGLDREVKKFVLRYGRVETICAALAVACGQGSDLRTGTSRAVDQATEDRARTAFVDFGGQPQFTEGDSTTSESVKLSPRHDALALYLTRIIRSVWKSKVVSLSQDSAGISVKSAIPADKLVLVQENLGRLRNFLEANKGFIQGLSGPSDLQRVGSRQEEIALQSEHQALHALQKLMESISEGISFVLMLFEERVVDIFMRLDDTSRQQLRDLTYESLFSQESGKDLAKLLVKAIVNRNIESGSNVETVADALRRRCGSFCSPDDVVIFKAQEQLQRASEQSQGSTLRTLLNESLRLFERVAGSLTYANLKAAVEQYTALQYYAGAIQLCLVVAKEKDRGNSALAWINEGRPTNDPRQRAFEERKRCYELVHEIMTRLDAATASEPETIDGRKTLAAMKRSDAYGVVNGSDDEVFHFDLYEWYLNQNWTDRILAIDSPHVVTFLQRLADTDAQHADLLCRFYTNRSRFFEAAQVQASLAKSDFAIGIKDRITLLSRAKANASVTTTGVGRQQQQLLNREVTDLLEVAHIQDDLLERLMADSRVPPDRRIEIQKELDGPILGLTELFNTYADQAGYFDLCLLIYHAANYHNSRVIAETWENLIKNTHYEVEERQQIWEAYRAGQPLPEGVEAPTGPPPQPYELISAQIQTIAHRTSLDSLIFPIDTLLPIVCGYAISCNQDASIGADPCWPVLLFLQLGVSHAMVMRVLEQIFDTQETPFTGRRRKVVVQWINVVAESWVREVERRGGLVAPVGGGGGKGGDSGAGPVGGWVTELLGRCDEFVSQLLGSTRGSAETEELAETRRVNRMLQKVVATSASASMQGSLFFR